jgi:hypothetical protein
MLLHGYSDRIHHALAFTAKHYPQPVSRYDGQSGLIRASSVALILARYSADEPTIVAGILKQLVDGSPIERQASLADEIGKKFGAHVSATVAAAAEPRFDVLGRERSWKACRFEYLAKLLAAVPRVVDVAVADELHRLGSALVSVRRLGVEYLETAGVPHPEETRWWMHSLLDSLRAHLTWHRSDMLTDLTHLTGELDRRLAEVGF